VIGQDEGRELHVIDYSQIELRIMVHLSEYEALLRAFREGLEVHRATAAEVFGVAPGEVTSEAPHEDDHAGARRTVVRSAGGRGVDRPPQPVLLDQRRFASR